MMCLYFVAGYHGVSPGSVLHPARSTQGVPPQPEEGVCQDGGGPQRILHRVDWSEDKLHQSHGERV